MPLVSIVVPIYNIEKYLEKCIRSIIRQTYKELEIILVDDGSPDQCGEICERYAGRDPRIHVLHKVNGGLSDARNAGMAIAAGKYLLFVDGDDEIAENLVKSTVECAEKADADIVIFDFLEIEEDTGRRDTWSMPLPRNHVFNIRDEKQLLMTTPGAWNKLYRKALWDKTGLTYPKGRNFEDLSTTPKLLLHAPRIIYLESDPLYYYVLREGSIMRSHDFKRSYENRTAAINELCDYFAAEGAYERYKDELEFLALEHTYFLPIKEILLADPKNKYKKKFQEFTFNKFPEADQNCHIDEWLSGKEKLQLWLIKHKCYCLMRCLSYLRKCRDLKTARV